MILQKLSISNKLLITPVIGVFFLGISAFLFLGYSIKQNAAIENLNQSQRQLNALNQDIQKILSVEAGVNQILSWVSTGYSETVINQKQEECRKFIKEASLSLSDQKKNIDLSLTESLTLYDSILQYAKTYGEWMEKIFDMATTDLTVATTFLKPAEEQLSFLLKALKDLQTYQNDHCEQIFQKNHRFVQKLRILVFVILGIAALILLWISLSIAASIRNPILSLKDIMLKIAHGDLTLKAQEEGNNELSVVSGSLNETVESLRSIIQQMLSNSRTLSDFSQALTDMSACFAAAAEETRSQSEGVRNNTSTLSDKVNSISHATNEMSSSLNTMSLSVKEINTSLNEILSKCQEAMHISGKAGEETLTMQTLMNKLKEAAVAISAVVSLINDIADRTNLLALNARIEAASAGEAGKGFAVVANEVKELSKQTAEATHDISSQIEAVQNCSKESINALQSVAEIIKKIDDFSHVIVSAVEEHSASMSEITKSISFIDSKSTHIRDEITQSALQLTEISTNVNNIHDAAKNTANGIEGMKNKSFDLSKTADALKAIIQRFKL